MTKFYPYLIRVGLVLLAIVLAHAVGFSRGKARVKTEQATQVVTVVREAAVVAGEARVERSEKRTGRAVESKKEAERVEEAIQGSPHWSAQPVPDGVWEALGGE